MKKKVYSVPSLSVVEFEVNDVICTSPTVNTVNSNNAGLNYVGGGTGAARSNNRGGGIWDDEE